MSAENTAWGKINMYTGETAASDALAASMELVGVLKEETIGLTTEEGKKYELWGSGHELLDELQGEPSLLVSATITQVPEEIRKKFWDIKEVGTGDDRKLQVKSMVTRKKWSVKFASEVPGSETFEAPLCSVNMKPVFSETEGWSAEVSFRIIKSKITGVLFQFGVVPASAPASK